MRQWMTDPKLMCQKHLLGEHVEMHMFVGTIARGVSIDGYIRDGLLNPAEIKSRHDELVAEMKRRGMKHSSPLDVNPTERKEAFIDAQAAMRELIRRCGDCAALHHERYPHLVDNIHKGGDGIENRQGEFFYKVNGVWCDKAYKNRNAADLALEAARRQMRKDGVIK